MANTLIPLFDPGALAIVVAGTGLACAARSGWREFGAAVQAASRLARRGFNPAANRKALALALTAIQRQGAHRADPALPPDHALGLMLETYLRNGTLEALGRVRRTERALDEARRISATQVFDWAGELAPVLGLIGTLYGLTQLAPGGAINPAMTIMAAVSTAVLTTFYGALLAHLLCHPLAGAIARRGLGDEIAREALADWFVEQVGKMDIAAQERRAHLRGVV